MNAERIIQLDKDAADVEDAYDEALRTRSNLRGLLSVDPAKVTEGDISLQVYIKSGDDYVATPVGPDRLNFADVPAMMEHAVAVAEAAYHAALKDLAYAAAILQPGGPEAALAASQADIADQLGIPLEVVDGR